MVFASVALDSGIPGMYHYFADIGAFDLSGRMFPLQQGPRPFGREFWFSVANFDTGWSWALAGAGPTVGDEHWSGVRSTGGTPCGDGGPHCGPWSELPGRDFAFRLTNRHPGTGHPRHVGSGTCTRRLRQAVRSVPVAPVAVGVLTTQPPGLL